MNWKPLTVVALTLTLTACGKPVDEPSVKNPAEGLFSAVNTDQDDQISTKEIGDYQGLVFKSMDANGDLSVTREEFNNWDTVWVFEAQQDSKAAETRMEVGKGRIFNSWDQNNDGKLTEAEHKIALLAEYKSANVDGSDGVSLDEFSNGFVMAKELSAAVGK